MIRNVIKYAILILLFVAAIITGSHGEMNASIIIMTVAVLYTGMFLNKNDNNDNGFYKLT